MEENSLIRLQSVMKCTKCRKDKKKCIPSEDEDEDRCQRCVEKGCITCVREYTKVDRPGSTQAFLSLRPESNVTYQQVETFSESFSAPLASMPSDVRHSDSMSALPMHIAYTVFSTTDPFVRYTVPYQQYVSSGMNTSDASTFQSPGASQMQNPINHHSHYRTEFSSLPESTEFADSQQPAVDGDQKHRTGRFRSRDR